MSLDKIHFDFSLSSPSRIYIKIIWPGVQTKHVVLKKYGGRSPHTWVAVPVKLGWLEFGKLYQTSKTE